MTKIENPKGWETDLADIIAQKDTRSFKSLIGHLDTFSELGNRPIFYSVITVTRPDLKQIEMAQILFDTMIAQKEAPELYLYMTRLRDNAGREGRWFLQDFLTKKVNETFVAAFSPDAESKRKAHLRADISASIAKDDDPNPNLT